MTACRECGATVEPLAVIGSIEVRPALCPACGAAAASRDEHERRQHLIGAALAAAGATPRMRDWSLDTYPQGHGGADAVAAAREWLERYMDGRAENLYLWGEPGSGKTGLAWGIVREVLRREYAAARDADRPMRNVAALIDVRAYLAEVREGIRTDRHASKRPANVPLCVLDDLGAERDTAWATETLGLVVAARYEAMLPTIVTSNYDPDTLADRLGREDTAAGGRMLSRLCGDGATVLHLAAPDRRISGLPT